MRFLILVPLFAAALPRAEEISVQTVDGLNRPADGVQVVVSCSESGRFVNLESGTDGIARGTYDAARCTPTSVSIAKVGYQTYVSGFRPRYVLRSEHSPEDVARIAAMARDEQRRELRELLAGDFSVQWGEFEDAIFRQEARLRPALRDLAAEPEVTVRARQLLALIGAPEDVQFIMRLEPRPDSGVFAQRWRYDVATALVSPDSEEEWDFLARCARNEFNDRWVDEGAIQTLKLTPSARSEQILEEALKKNEFRARGLTSAIEYIKSGPAPLAGSDLAALARRVAQLIGRDIWQGNGSPLSNEAGDKALIDITLETGEDRYIYTATFHRAGDLWKLCGVRETLQAMIIRTDTFVPLVEPELASPAKR